MFQWKKKLNKKILFLIISSGWDCEEDPTYPFKSFYFLFRSTFSRWSRRLAMTMHMPTARPESIYFFHLFQFWYFFLCFERGFEFSCCTSSKLSVWFKRQISIFSFSWFVIFSLICVQNQNIIKRFSEFHSYLIQKCWCYLLKKFEYLLSDREFIECYSSLRNLRLQHFYSQAYHIFE